MIKLIKKNKGFTIFVAGLLFNFVESLYFGWGTTRGFNLEPQSIAEYVCDIIAIIVMVLGCFLMGLEIYRPSTTVNFNIDKIETNNAEEFVKEIKERVHLG